MTLSCLQFGSALGFVGFIRACPGNHHFYWGSLGSLRSALGVVRFIGFIPPFPGVVMFIRIRRVRSGAPSCSLGFLVIRSGSPWESSGSLGFVGFVPALPWGPSGLFGFAGFVHGTPWRSLVSFVGNLGVVGFIRVRCDRLGVPWGSSGSFGFVQVRRGGLRDHSGSLGSFERALGVVGFIRVR